MALLRRRKPEQRRWSRRLADEEARAFVADVLEETREVYRTASGEFQLKPLCLDVFATPDTTELRWLRSRGVSGADFYRRELAPSWEGLDRAERARRLDAFIELSQMLGAASDDSEPDPELLDLIATVHVKVLLLAWAFDRTYGYVDRLFNGPLQYREHRRRAGAEGPGRARASG